ncbi:MAG TPA: hypothetical protein VGF32_02550 [Streptosporangiaceae bacterium]|jgi:hypothetical protein
MPPRKKKDDDAQITVTGVVRTPYAMPGETVEVADSPQVRRYLERGYLREPSEDELAAQAESGGGGDDG